MYVATMTILVFSRHTTFKNVYVFIKIVDRDKYKQGHHGAKHSSGTVENELRVFNVGSHGPNGGISVVRL